MKRVAIALIALAMACEKKPSPIGGATTATASGASVASAAPGAIAAEPPVLRPRIDAAEIAIPPGKSELHVSWSVPGDTEINDEAPFAVRWTSSDGLTTSPTDIHGHGKDVESGFDVPLDVMPGSAGGQLAGDIDLVVCDTVTHSVCVPIKRRVELTFAVGAKGSPKGTVTLPLPSAKP